MYKEIKSILFVIGVVMVFTAQVNRPDEKGKPAAHNNQSRPQQTPQRPQVQTRKQAPQQVVHRTAPIEQAHTSQPFHQERAAPRVYAVPAAAPVRNNRLLNRQHHKNWQPRYNFYDNQYHFYPYVNIASTVELTPDCVSVGLDGQTYYYDQGTFYQQDAQGQYFAVAPPLGIIVNALPVNARQISIDGQFYFRYKGVFYVQVAQGYQVVGPVQPAPADTQT